MERGTRKALVAEPFGQLNRRLRKKRTFPAVAKLPGLHVLERRIEGLGNEERVEEGAGESTLDCMCWSAE